MFLFHMFMFADYAFYEYILISAAYCFHSPLMLLFLFLIYVFLAVNFTA